MMVHQSLALDHSWPLWEAPRHFELGCILNGAITDALQPSEVGEIGPHHAGIWECNLSNDALLWSGGVYDIFGLPRGARVGRKDAIALYAESSRVTMERLRAYAIKHRRGFTIDIQILPPSGETRWVRLIAAPSFDGERVTHLRGLKLVL